MPNSPFTYRNTDLDRPHPTEPLFIQIRGEYLRLQAQEDVKLVITQFYEVGFETTTSLVGFSYSVDLSPEAFFGYLLDAEMFVALPLMAPAAKAAERIGVNPVVALGFAAYSLFPVVLIDGLDILAPVMPLSWAMILIFAFSGLRFAGLSCYKALIVGSAEGGRVTGTYYLLQNTVVIPSAAGGGYL
ncbi:MAG: hypothetical protein J07HQW2_03727 [Haloquadratum walsbyi J07HQW2]|jgi:hypothetical protein|uniref:Uncharacterized protein n=1 Tax=Haloquadratum walsbyi J07HQW2 TaxID=1238425 RepID=U1PXP1_9EURY|nr:MAG: hypothetical protein J07HQW2_03727 [Haloquadratum walsbyi J07HQW2]